MCKLDGKHLHSLRLNYKQLSVRLLLAAVLWALCAYSLPLSAAVDINPAAGTTSATFLKYGVGSRAVAMGGSFGGLADDITAMYWNPAGLAQLTSSELSVTHNESFEGIRDDFAGYAFPYRNGVLGIAFYGLYTPRDLERRSGLFENDPYEPLSSVEGLFQAYDIAGHISYARYFKDNLAFGASLKYIQETIDTYSAFGVALDIGSLYKFKNVPLSLGLSIQNIGTPIKFIDKAYDLPLNVRLGSAYKVNNNLTATLDFNQPNDDYLFISAGAEYSPMSLFAIRAGYQYRINGLELGDLYGFSAGVGFNIKMQNMLFKIDYAFVPFSVLGDSHRVTIGIVFGNPNSKTPVVAESVQSQGNGQAASAQLALPKDDVPIAVQQASSQYDMFAIKIKINRRLAGGHQSLYILSGNSAGGDIESIEGTLTSAVKGLAIEVGEKAGEGKVYKHFIFQKNYNIPVYKATCRLKVPKNITNPVVRTEEGTELEIEKVSEDDKNIYYTLFMDTFMPFRVESR